MSGGQVLPVTVYVPCYNAAEHIGGCLEALAAQTYPVEEILVIDDGSTDDTASRAQRFGARVIRHPGNWGLAEARNTAMRQARTAYVASVDADAWPEPDWLARLMRHFASPVVAGAGGKLLERHRASGADRWRHAHMRQHFGERRLVNPLHLFGANTVFRRECVLAAGGYPHDRRYRTNNEDYYISRRLRGAGWTLIYDPEARCWHQRRDTYASLFRTYYRWFMLHRPCPETWRGVAAKLLTDLRLMRGILVDDWAESGQPHLPANLRFVWHQWTHTLLHYAGHLRRRWRG